MNPKFSVGEVVILQSKYYPQGNGEYIIRSIDETCKPLSHTKVLSPYGYFLEGNVFSWAESALRKKHQKGDMSFKELMSDLKTNIQERIS